jgi:hypothetical protein
VPSDESAFAPDVLEVDTRRATMTSGTYATSSTVSGMTRLGHTRAGIRVMGGKGLRFCGTEALYNIVAYLPAKNTVPRHRPFVGV